MTTSEMTGTGAELGERSLTSKTPIWCRTTTSSSPVCRSSRSASSVGGRAWPTLEAVLEDDPPLEAFCVCV